MRVKIGDKIFCSMQEPIAIILSSEEKSDIANMSEADDTFCSFPTGTEQKVITEFMKID